LDTLIYVVLPFLTILIGSDSHHRRRFGTDENQTHLPKNELLSANYRWRKKLRATISNINNKQNIFGALLLDDKCVSTHSAGNNKNFFLRK
jgi:hypothetical protein